MVFMATEKPVVIKMSVKLKTEVVASMLSVSTSVSVMSVSVTKEIFRLLNLLATLVGR